MTNVRAALHSFDLGTIRGVLNDGETAASHGRELAERALSDWRTRRIGMALSLGVILLLMALLVLKIRSIEAKPT
jgi:hypothetical protein